MFKFNKTTSETSENVALWPLYLTLNTFNISIHCSIQTCAATTQINWTIYHSFLSCQPLNSTQKISPPEQATLFMTLMEYLISQAGAFQVLVYESSKQNLNQKMPQIFTTKILNYEGFNWVIQFLYDLSTLVFLF